eukprot:scaffold32177_cov90-Skeletonema_marinoi.AAC.1
MQQGEASIRKKKNDPMKCREKWKVRKERGGERSSSSFKARCPPLLFIFLHSRLVFFPEFKRLPSQFSESKLR